jgi:aquaporin Z
MNKYLMEVIGTFFLVLTIGCTGLGNVALAPLAIGAVLMVMVYAGGHISGAHYNPAVTLGIFIRGKCPAADVIPYWIAQFVGAAAAAFAAMYLRADLVPEAVEPFSGNALVFLAEFLFTFALVFVVLNVATAAANEGNSYFGLAIGFTVLIGAMAVGDISGGAFNPAVAVGGALMKLFSFQQIWLHIVAECAAAVAAALVFKVTVGADEPKS